MYQEVQEMTEADAIVYLRSIRDDYASRLHIGITPKKMGDWLNPNQRQHYQDRIEALDVAIVYLSLKI